MENGIVTPPTIQALSILIVSNDPQDQRVLPQKLHIPEIPLKFVPVPSTQYIIDVDFAVQAMLKRHSLAQYIIFNPLECLRFNFESLQALPPDVKNKIICLLYKQKVWEKILKRTGRSKTPPPNTSQTLHLLRSSGIRHVVAQRIDARQCLKSQCSCYQ